MDVERETKKKMKEIIYKSDPHTIKFVSSKKQYNKSNKFVEQPTAEQTDNYSFVFSHRNFCMFYLHSNKICFLY